MDYSLFCQQIDVSRETFDRLVHYVERLLKWQKQINLIGASTMDDIWNRHILDSLQLIRHIDGEGVDILDIGSGGGLPAIPMAITTTHHITMVESDQRKVIFLQEVIRELGLSMTVINDRIESIAGKPYPYITARACAPLEQLLEWAEGFLSPKTICLFPKGEKYIMELEKLRTSWQYDVTPIPSKTEAKAAIIKLSHIKRM